MGKSRIHVRAKRHFTEEFKKAREKEYERGEFSVNEISTLFSIQSALI